MVPHTKRAPHPDAKKDSNLTIIAGVKRRTRIMILLIKKVSRFQQKNESFRAQKRDHFVNRLPLITLI